MIINIDTPNPIPTKPFFLPHVQWKRLNKIFPTWNSLIKGKNLQQLVYDRLWKIQ